MPQIDAVLIGDSWISHTGRITWPEVLCKRRGWSYINFAEYGAISSACINQLHTIPADALINDKTVWIIGVGGNDILENVYFNPKQNIRAIQEICSCTYGYRQPEIFYSGIAKTITDNISAFIKHMKIRFNAKKFIIASNPIAYELPLCNLVSNVCIPIFSQQVVNGISRIMNSDLQRIYRHPNIDVRIFNQVRAYNSITWSVDGFHPTNKGHRALATEADIQIRSKLKLTVHGRKIYPSVAKYIVSRTLILANTSILHALTAFPLCNPIMWYHISNNIRVIICRRRLFIATDIHRSAFVH
jgi:lysophospholipase L1-like esterase